MDELNKEEILEIAINHEARLRTENFSKAEIETRKAKLTPLNDTIFEHIFAKKRNYLIATEIVNSIYEVYGLPKIGLIEKAKVQKSTVHTSFLDGNTIENKKMVGDFVGRSGNLTISIEGQSRKQEDYDIRSVLTSSNVMREGLKRGKRYKTSRDVIGINILGFKMPSLSYKKDFLTRIVRSDYDMKIHFLAEKYSDYYLELPKLPKEKESVKENYVLIWEMCKAFSVKYKNLEEVLNMQTITSPGAVHLLEEFYNSLTDDVLVYEALTKEEAANIYLDQLKEKKIEGKIEGKIESKMEIALEMLTEGFDLKMISKVLKMPINWVERLIEENNYRPKSD